MVERVIKLENPSGAFVDSSNIETLCKDITVACQTLEENGYESIVIIATGDGHFKLGSKKGRWFLKHKYALITDFIEYCRDEMPEMGIDDDQVIQEALFPEDCQKSEMSGLERAVYEDTEDAQLRDDQSKFIKSAPDNIPYPIQLKESESLTVSADDNDVPTYSGPSADGANQIPLAKEDLNKGSGSPSYQKSFVKKPKRPQNRQASRPKRKQTGIKFYTCDICHRTVSTAQRLRIHKRIHTGEKPYCCDTCGKHFRDSSTYSNHRQIHSAEKPFACELCPKTFKTQKSLTLHKHVHSTGQSYPCEQCGKCFTLSRYLTRHRLVHETEKRYFCHICNTQCRNSVALSSHQRKHTGEVPYVCDFCGKQCTTLTYLKRHRLMHTGERPFSCEVCGSKFTVKTHLIRHQRKHTGDKPYCCDYCGKTYARSDDLCKHLRLHQVKEGKNIIASRTSDGPKQIL